MIAIARERALSMLLPAGRVRESARVCVCVRVLECVQCLRRHEPGTELELETKAKTSGRLVSLSCWTSSRASGGAELHSVLSCGGAGDWSRRLEPGAGCRASCGLQQQQTEDGRTDGRSLLTAFPPSSAALSFSPVRAKYFTGKFLRAACEDQLNETWRSYARLSDDRWGCSDTRFQTRYEFRYRG
ncbi:hypothetical protein SRHO_G00155200 [Serrasalmus rhombeus]